MKKRRFLAIAAALAVGMTLLSAPVAAFATEPGDDYEDISDDEQEAGEQTTIPAPDGDDDPGAGGNGGNGNSSGSGGNSGGGNSSGGANSSGTASSSGSGQGSSTAKSSDSSLASLGISPGSLSPAFSPNTYEYTATVDADVTRVSIPARPNSSTAVIASVSGAKSIRPGTNTVRVVVEAANGKTSTYTITVYCGQGAQDTASSEPQDASEPTSVEGQISDIQPEELPAKPDETKEPEEKAEDGEVSFDSNGYLIYRGEAYIPSELMPEGEYVSLEKYNSLYEQAQADKTTSNRMMIIFVVALVLLLIVIVNLVFKLRDVRQDAKLGIGEAGYEDEDGFSHEGRVTKASKMRERAAAANAAAAADVKIPEQAKRGSARNTERSHAEKTKPGAKTKTAMRAQERSEVPVRTAERRNTRSARSDRDLEILDLNDL